MKLTRAFLDDIRALIASARASVARGVDLIQVHTSFEIGRRIVEQEQKGKSRAGYGEAVITALEGQLTAEFGRGFSERNLANMRAFYQVYRDRSPILQSSTAKSGGRPILQTPSAKSAARPIGEPPAEQLPIAQSPSGQSGFGTDTAQSAFRLGWSHYVFLMGIKNPDERSFYEIEAAAQGWTVKELRRQFDSSLYERLALSRDKAGIRDLARRGQVVAGVADLLKEPLVLEFLGLDERARYSETDLESAVIDQIERFLLELGKGFLFESRQRRFTFDDEHYFVDLVFYNRLLRCYVLIDLKIGKLTHQDLGQMQMYVNSFDEAVKTPEENPTVGIILCKQRNSALVRITLPKGANIHAREYRLYLPSKEELRRKLVEWAGDSATG